MKTIHVENTLRCHLLACNVPESAIRIVHSETSDIATVIVQAPHGRKIRDYSVSQLLNGKPYVVDEMISIADWYHGGSIPQKETWWQMQTTWERFIWFWLFAFMLFLILSTAKHFNLYE